MKIRQTILPVFILTLIFIVSCDKNSAPVIENSFTWKYDNINYTARLDTAYTSSIPFAPLILATATNNSLFAPSAELQIALTSFSLGNYTFAVGGPNRINFADPLGNGLQTTGGSLNISSSSSTSIWGSFTATLNNGKTLSGNFLSTPVRP